MTRKSLFKTALALVLASLGLTAPGELTAQLLTQDARGASTILAKGEIFGFDLQDQTLQFTYGRSIEFPASKRSLFYGLNVRGKNRDGIASVFSEGLPAPEAKAEFILGFTMTDRIDPRSEHLQAGISQNRAIVQGKKESIYSRVEEIIDEWVADVATDRRAEAKAKLMGIVNDYSVDAWNELFGKYRASLKKEDVREKAAFQLDDPTLSEFLSGDRTCAALDREFERLKRELFRIRNQVKFYRFALYGRIGVQAQEQKLLSFPEAIDLNTRFEKKSFVGWSLELGSNYRIANWMFGFSLGLQEKNNLDLLTKTEFLLRTVSESGNQTLFQDNKILAYVGEYKEYTQYRADVDLLKFVPAGLDHVLVVDFYLRHSVADEKGIAPSTTAIGMSLHFFKKDSKFIGGIFLEAPDISNNIARAVGASDLKPFYRRFAVGVTAKLALNSMMIEGL